MITEKGSDDLEKAPNWRTNAYFAEVPRGFGLGLWWHHGSAFTIPSDASSFQREEGCADRSGIVAD